MTPAPRPLVVATNDDGVHARGLRALVRALSTFCDVVTLAPSTEQSATSHAITLHRPLRLHTLSEGRHSLDGTPVDCVYVALNLAKFLPRKPDAVISGINHGLNLGADVFYSGTVAGAREGALRDVPAMAISAPSDSDYGRVARRAKVFVQRLVQWRLAHPDEPAPLFNVNFPKGVPRGARSTSLGRRVYEDLVEVRSDPRGRHYLWIGGPSVSHPSMSGSDTEAYEQGYIGITALSMDPVQLEHAHIAREIARGVRTTKERVTP